MDRLVGWVNGRSLLSLAFVVFAGGTLLLCLSFVLGIDSVRDPASGRDVGYTSATNWTAPLMLLMPLFTAGLAWLVHVLARLFPDVQARMLTPAGSEADWPGHLRSALPWLIAFSVVAVAMSAYECWNETYRWLYAGDGQPEQYSWTTAALVEGETVSPGLNFAFVVAAWSMQTLAKLLVGVMVWQSLTLGVWLAKHGLGFAGARLVPDLADPDPRCGFQRFELTGAILFGSVALFLMVVWLIVAQHLHQSGATGASGPYAHAFDYGSDPVAALLDTGGFASYAVFWARCTGLGVVVLTLVVVVAVLVPVTMRSARAYALGNVEEIAAQQGVSAASARTRLDAMPVWPYRFVSAPAFCFLVVFATAGLWFFRLAPWALFATIAVVSLRARGRLARRGHVRYAHAVLIAVALVGALLVGTTLRTNAGSRGPVPAGPVVATGGYKPEYRNSHALLIGIGYEGSTWLTPLPNAERDVAKVKGTLEGTADQWTIRTLIGAEATRSRILDELGRLGQEAQRDDRVFIFYAGHGGATGERSGWILPADAQPPAGDRGGATWIYFQRFTVFFNDVRAKHVLLALDCCYSGRVTRSGGVPRASGDESLARLKERHLRGKAHVVIASGRPNELVADGPVGGHSPFATALCAALESPHKVITAPVLYGRIAEDFLGNGAAQSPQIDFIEQDGEFLFFPKPE